MIDEVDKTSNNLVFLQFLCLLRKKFLARKEGMDYTFHSVILAGVYDIKNIKLKMMEEGLHTSTNDETKVYNSPWNIAVDFEVDMSFDPDEISTMLKEYEADHSTGMDIACISDSIHKYTSGYPFLVSKICLHIDEKLNRDWSLNGILTAVNALLFEKNTLFEDMFKNLENNKELYELTYQLLVLSEPKPFAIDNPIVSIGAVYGFFRNNNGKIAIANKIFELRMINYFISKDLCNKKQVNDVHQNEVVRDGKFDMELCLRKFAEHYNEIFSLEDAVFLERHGRLLFLSYLKPLINGYGFYHLESQLTDMRRMDIVVDFGRQQFIIELKVWRGDAYQNEGYVQLSGYLEAKNMDIGYMITFDFRKKANKDCMCEWIEVNGKQIFSVVV
jgi:hypothetical protein